MNNIIVKSIFLILLLTFCSDEIENYYSDYNSMKVSDSYKKGWIPDFIPESASDIYEKHNLDNNKVWISFKCNISDLSQVTANIVLADENEKMLNILRQNFDLPDTVSFYILSDKEIIAVDNKMNRIYYIRTRY